MSSGLIVVKVVLEKLEITKTFQFEPTATIADVIKLVNTKVPESVSKQNQDYGIFHMDNNDPSKSQWLETEKTLHFYECQNGTELRYRDKNRYLKVKMLDGAIKTVLVDDSQMVGIVLETICDKVGITNVEEYSLFIEDVPEEKKEYSTGTLRAGGTLGRNKDKSVKVSTMQKVEERDKKKMDTLKKKLHTDDETKWLGHDKTLRECGVDDSTLVVLRRKYMYEQSVNIKNPVEINLLYVQSRDGILEGAYPVTQEEACKFAAYQIQIQFGDIDESRYKSGYFDLKEFLPKEYGRKKEVEKKIKEEHKTIQGMDALNAKYKYIQLCQNLKTYGVTFFLVKEKMKGKNRLVPRLLGIDKESVLRVDEKTKDVLKTWPLTQVRRWAASPNSFTLDFGDYTEGYYSVQTSEGEQISQLIAGYIDIILKKRRAHEMFDGEGEEESPMLEEEISPQKFTIIQQQNNKATPLQEGQVAIPSVMRPGGKGASPYNVGSMADEQFTGSNAITHQGTHQKPAKMQARMDLFNPGQKALLKNCDDGNMRIKIVVEDLGGSQGLIPENMGNDPQSLKWKENQVVISKNSVANRLAAMSAATAAIISLTSGDPEAFNYTAVGAGVSTITSNLEDLVHGIKMLAALLDDDGNSQNLLQAARDLANAFSNLLSSLHPGDAKPRTELLNAAGDIGTASAGIMNAIGDSEMNAEFQELLLKLAKAVANATAGLVLQAKNVASAADDTAKQDNIINSAKHTAMTTSQLVACMKVLAPHILSPICQDQMIEAAKLVASSVDGVSKSCMDATDDDDVKDKVQNAAQDVTDALNNLLQHIRDGAHLRPGGQYDSACDDILNATDKLFNSMGNAGEMVKQAKILAQATSQLVNGIKGDAEGEDDDDIQKRLLAAAKVLADATAKLVEAAKGAAKNPNDKGEQENLKRAAEDLRHATNAAASNALKKKLILRLENAAKQAVANATQLISASKAAAPTNRNPASQQQLDDSCKVVTENSHELIHGIRGSQNNPDSPAAQLGLITASKNFIPPALKMVANSKAVVPTVENNAVALQMSNAGKNTQVALDELRVAAEKAAEACGSLEIDNALTAVKDLEDLLEEIRKAAEDGELKPLPEDNADERALEVGATSKTVGATMAQLLTAASQGNDSYTGIAARDTASALKVLANAVRGVAATSDNLNDQQAILNAAKELMHASVNLIEEAKQALEHPNEPDPERAKLAEVARGVSQALNNVVNCLPGQRVVEDAIEEIASSSMVLANENIIFPVTEEPFSQVQDKLNQSSLTLNSAANDVVHAAKAPTGQLAKASAKFSVSYQDFQRDGLTLAGQIKDKEAQDLLISDLRKTSTVSSKLLLASKALAADPGAPNAKNLLAAAAKGVTDAINQLLNQALTAAPGQKECDSAVRNVEAISHVLDNPVEPVNEASFYECLDTATEKSQVLAQSMQDITSALKQEDHDVLVDAVGGASDAVCQLTESTAQAAYLVAIADPSSTAGRAGLVDQSSFAKARDAIKGACEGLLNQDATQHVLSAATVIAKHTAALCNACKAASTKTDNPVAKRHFVQSAKDVANNTANLVKYIKVYASDMNPENHQNCAYATKPLLEAVENLVTYASSPEFASVPAKISPQAKAAQYPLIMSGKSMVSSSTNYFISTKSLAVNNKDQPTWQLFAQHSRTLADAMKKIVTAIKENAPGQVECDKAGEVINEAIKKINNASIAAVSNSLEPTSEDSLKGFEEKMMLTCAQLQEAVPLTVEYAKGSPEKIGHAVIKLANLVDPLADSAIGFASKLPGGSQKQTELLDSAKTICESASNLVLSTKDAGGNPKAVNFHPQVDEAAEDLVEAVKDLTQQLEETAGDTGAVTALVDSIHRARSSVNMFVADYRDRSHRNAHHVGEPMEASFVEHQDHMVKELKNIAMGAQDMVGKSNTKPDELGGISQDICKNYNALSEDTKMAIRATNQQEIAERLKGSVDTLGNSCACLVQSAGNVQSNPLDSYAKNDLSDKAKDVSEKVSFVLATLQAGSIGTQECINAISTLAGIIGDIDTTVMFAQAGTLNPENADDSFGDHRETILKTAKNLVEDTKNLVVAAQGSQEQLATSAQNVLGSMTKLVDNVKLGATALGTDDNEAQVMLLMAAKDVASALTDLISATKNSSGKPASDPAMENLKVSAKTMVTSVSSLLKTVRSVEDEASRGVRAIESTVDAVKQAVVNLQLGEPERVATPEDLIRATKGVTLATAKAVAAGNSGKQEDVVQAANVGRRYCTELLIVVKAAAFNAESESIKVATIVKGRDTAQAYCEVLDHVASVIVHPTPQKKQHLTVLSKKVAYSVGELVKSAEDLKGTDWVNPEDPNVIAENELLGAAASIEAAARKLAELKPRARPKQADESLNFEEQILEAAKSITAAAGALVKAATAAQRELVATGRTSARQDGEDQGQWSQGLISAARMVAGTVITLCETANAAVQGNASEERIIASAKGVAGSTAQLLLASRVKADSNSKTQRNLQIAGNEVKKASDNLVRAASNEASRGFTIEVQVSQRKMKGIRQEREAENEVLRIERELEEARLKLATSRKNQYRKI